MECLPVLPEVNLTWFLPIHLKDQTPTDLELSLTPLLNQDHSESAVGVAATMAHEMGHNFGMSHDSTGCCQARAEDGGCIMAAATGYETDLTVKLSQLITCFKTVIFFVFQVFCDFLFKYPNYMCTSQVMNNAVFLLFGLKEKARWICAKPCRLSWVCMVIHSWMKSYLCAKIYCLIIVWNVFLAVLNEKKKEHTAAAVILSLH